MTQLDLISPNRFAGLEDPEQEEGKMPDLDTAEPEEIALAQDECLGNKAEKSVVKAEESTTYFIRKNGIPRSLPKPTLSTS